MQNGVIYRGPSLYDGAPIVAIATYSDRNTKTGGVVQTYILCENIDPREASKAGADKSICGTCPHRGEVTTDPARKIAKGRDCYVNLGQGVLITWRSYHRGVYPLATRQRERAAIGAGRVVRVGTYGDPAAVPEHVWTDLLRDAASHTAYTHSSGWRPDLAMQSADTYQQARAAWAKGQRTFRVTNGVDDIDTRNEVLCPASKEAGRRTTCAACKLCGGTSTPSPKSIAIPMH
jgi:hypothetical protein